MLLKQYYSCIAVSIHSESDEDADSNAAIDSNIVEEDIASNSIPSVSSDVFDIGKCLDDPQISDHTKFNLIEHPWSPPEGYKLPFSSHNKKGKVEKRYLSLSHLKLYPWLVFSDAKKGLYCKYCTLFATARAGGVYHQTPLHKLVVAPLGSYNVCKTSGKDRRFGDTFTQHLPHGSSFSGQGFSGSILFAKSRNNQSVVSHATGPSDRKQGKIIANVEGNNIFGSAEHCVARPSRRWESFGAVRCELQ
jgi:hypothetical protein